MGITKLTKLEKYWILYDVANSAFVLMVSTLIPIYFKNIAIMNGISSSQSTAYFSYALSISTLIIAILGPVLGTFGDNKGYKKIMFSAFLGLGVVGCMGLAVPKVWRAFLIIFIIARVGFSGSIIFYDSMINDVTTDEKIDKVSSFGYAFGYIGSCIPFIACLALVLFYEKLGIAYTTASEVSFILVGAWWLIMTIPYLKNYKQIFYVDGSKNYVRNSLIRCKNIFSELRSNRKVLMFLISFFFYIDGVYTIIEMATVYGKDVGLGDSSMLLALLLTQIVAFPCSILFVNMVKRINIKNMISICILAYIFVTVFALQLNTALEFWFLAVFVGVFQGTIQALSRSYYAKIIPKEKSSEYFGIFDIFGKGASFMGTILMGVSTQIFGTSKAGVVCIGIMLVIGLVLFRYSNVKKHELEYSLSINEM